MPLSLFVFFFSSRRRHTRYIGDWSSDVCSSDLSEAAPQPAPTRQADAPALSPAMNANITLIPKPVAVRAPAPELSHSKVHSIPQEAASTSAAPTKSSIEKTTVTKPTNIAPAQQA